MDKSSNKFQQGWKKACNCTQQDLQKYGVCFSDCSWFHLKKKTYFSTKVLTLRVFKQEKSVKTLMPVWEKCITCVVRGFAALKHL